MGRSGTRWCSRSWPTSGRRSASAWKTVLADCAAGAGQFSECGVRVEQVAPVVGVRGDQHFVCASTAYKTAQCGVDFLGSAVDLAAQRLLEEGALLLGHLTPQHLLDWLQRREHPTRTRVGARPRFRQ